ncbi:hypothetical protein F2Q69_00053637 [Brassica cretica]|uniref:Uncharacterized protein n=1 Tax=Brassica cretica TaxID=69181 RepID=A0A8S9N4F1_BRACR|nr:hypothetical protein F2Q69_00053637 [Brassica cretica]
MVDLGRGAISVVNLRFHRSDFCSRFPKMIAKIADLGFLASRFPIPSVFAASVPSLLLAQFFLFVPEDSFFFFGHRIIELGIIFSRTTSFPTRIYVCVFVHKFGLTARIHIDTFNFSVFLVFHDRGKISRIFPCLRRGGFVGILPGRIRPVYRSRKIVYSSAD